MGGRGWFEGKDTTLEYGTITQIGNIKVVAHLGKRRNELPEYATPNAVYASVGTKGTLTKIRVYNEKGEAKLDLHFAHSHKGKYQHTHKWYDNKRDDRKFYDITDTQNAVYVKPLYEGGIKPWKKE